MKIKRFTGADMRDVMRQVREAFGPDAVILETGRGPDGVSISAAMDFDPAAWQRSRGQVQVPRVDCTDEDFADEPVTTDAATAAATPGDPGGDAEMRRMREEVQSIRCLLEAQLSRLIWDDHARRSPEVAGIMRNLTNLGLTPDVVQRLVRGTANEPVKNAWTASLKQLVGHLGVCEEDLICRGGRFAIIGPTGVGKTTTIAKLAARYAMQGDAGDIALVTTDTYRIGAREQLETFGRILGVPVYVADSTESLANTLRALADKRLVLIDTAGMGQRDLRLARELACLKDADQDIEVLLALPANAQTDSMQEIVDAFLTARPMGCILTKIDEATSLGGAFSTLIRSGLPLAYVTNGQRVPEDLHLARARQAWLVKAAVELMRRRETPVSEDHMAEHFAEVAADACA
jgi:flagellar biosynthesis protein FlhF